MYCVRTLIVTFAILTVAVPVIGGEAAKDAADKRPLSAGEIVTLAVGVVSACYFFFPEVFAAVAYVLARGKHDEP